MVLGIECAVMCLLMFLICYLGTGSDSKNIKSFRAYPDEVQKIILSKEEYKDKIKPVNNVSVFVSNLILFTIILFIFGIFMRTTSFVYNFTALLILGETANLFDLLIVDMCWWRNAKRIRFSFIPEKEKYQNPKQHILAFVRGAIMFVLVALIDGALLMLF